MFEKYDINNLYVCEIDDIIPMGITNFGGCVSIEYTSSHRYQTIVCLKNGKYYIDKKVLCKCKKYVEISLEL